MCSTGVVCRHIREGKCDFRAGRRGRHAPSVRPRGRPGRDGRVGWDGIGGFMSDSIEKAVKERYGAVALSGLSSEQGGVRAVAEAFGYTAEELAAIPAGANMGLSCGNPLATASLREGEVVVDLGSGGGLDVFLAARKVCASGRAIGI